MLIAKHKKRNGKKIKISKQTRQRIQRDARKFFKDFQKISQV